jgi:D-alanyl-lipoteichoic acid acyltransferase DltB (MBOAT superfamily)
MANGLSHVLGFKPTENFRAPYLSTSISDFWTRWHITFSAWLRDYLFLPITYAVMRRIKGERFLGVQAATWGYLPGVLFTMLLGGLWHGASWTLVAWGFWHGLFLMASHLSRGIRKRAVRLTGLRRAPILHRGIRIISTFTLVSFAWVFFRANTLSDAFYIISHIFQETFAFAGKVAGRLVFSRETNPLVDLYKIMKLESYQLFFLAAAILILMAVDRQSERGDFWVRLKTKPFWIRFLLYYSLVMSILLFSALKSGPFIYFKF